MLENIVIGLADNFMAAFLSIIAMISIALGGATLLFTLFFADIMIGVGLALGPVALAFSVSNHFRGLMGQWLNFMFGAMLTKVVAMIIASIIVTAMTGIQLAAISAATAGAAFANTGAMIGIIFLGVILTFIAKDADKIATGIFGGVSTVKGPSGGDFMRTGRATGSNSAAMTALSKNVASGTMAGGKGVIAGWKANSGGSFAAKASAALRGAKNGAMPHIAKAAEAMQKDFSKTK